MLICKGTNQLYHFNQVSPFESPDTGRYERMLVTLKKKKRLGENLRVEQKSRFSNDIQVLHYEPLENILM